METYHELITTTHNTRYFSTREELLDAFSLYIRPGDKFWVGTSSDNAVSIYVNGAPGVNFAYIKAVTDIDKATEEAEKHMLYFK